jgi:hypothetical protein
MLNKDVRVGLVLMMAFIALFAISFTFEGAAMTSRQTGAAFFPRAVLILAMGLTLLLVLKNLSRKRGPKKEGLSPGAKKRVAGSMLISILFCFSAVYIGTFVSVFLLTAAIMLLWGVRNAVPILLNGVLTAGAVYLVFGKVLLVQFPKGILF